MKSRKKVLIFVLIMVLIIICALALWQKDNLKALYGAATLEEDEIIQQISDRQEEQKLIAEKYNITVPTPDAEDIQALLDGTMTQEEFREKLGLKNWLNDSGDADSEVIEEKGEKSENSDDNSSNKEENNTSTTQSAAVDKCVAELYGVQSSITSQLGAIKQSVISQWNALPESERTEAKKSALISGAMSQASGLEGSADARVKSIINKYRQQIVAEGGDASVVDELWNYYSGLKSSEASYYMNKFL